ncbi:hypothetical protein SAMN05444748_102383 [Variovorax sp. OV700]|nr:hypothetical protein SAMN05444748_102383 [Variovorax sp. OV700]
MANGDKQPPAIEICDHIYQSTLTKSLKIS